MSSLEVSGDPSPQTPDEHLQSNTYWFHIFQAMVDHELAKLGPDAFAVYCVIKSHCNLKTGLSIPSIQTIAQKAGISERQVMRKIKTLEAEGYISKTRSRKYNEYSLTEKIAIKDSQGRPRALAHWKYRPAQIQSTVEELKRMLRHKQTVGQDIYIEHLHIVQSQTNIGFRSARPIWKIWLIAILLSTKRFCRSAAQSKNATALKSRVMHKPVSHVTVWQA